MKKEVISIFLVVLLIFMPFSNAQLSSIEIKDVNVNENSLQVLIQNNFNQDFNKEMFIINNQYEIIQEEKLSNFTAKYFVVNYQSGIKLNNLQVIINDNVASYIFTEQEDTFVINQAVSQTSELTQIESNSPISYIYSGSRLAKIQDNNIVYYHSDNIGSTSLQTDNLGNIKSKSDYLPFGKGLSFSSQGNEKYKFTGKEYDPESSLNYFNARYYNPSNGKFISVDDIFKPTEGGYQYVDNNPLILTDPSGNNPASSLGVQNQIDYGIYGSVISTYKEPYDYEAEFSSASYYWIMYGFVMPELFASVGIPGTGGVSPKMEMEGMPYKDPAKARAYHREYQKKWIKTEKGRTANREWQKEYRKTAAYKEYYGRYVKSESGRRSARLKSMAGNKRESLSNWMDQLLSGVIGNVVIVHEQNIKYEIQLIDGISMKVPISRTAGRVKDVLSTATGQSVISKLPGFSHDMTDRRVKGLVFQQYIDTVNRNYGILESYWNPTTGPTITSPFIEANREKAYQNLNEARNRLLPKE